MSNTLDSSTHALQAAATLADAVAGRPDGASVWPVAERVFEQLIGHQLFTVLAYNEASGLVTRVYSNRPDEYPVSGTKPMGPTPWGEKVLSQGQPYIGRNANDIRWAFPDHELIASMGLESTCNLPIRFAGETLGTVNLLHKAGFYDESCLPVGLVLATLLAPAMQHTSAALDAAASRSGKSAPGSQAANR